MTPMRGNGIPDRRGNPFMIRLQGRTAEEAAEKHKRMRMLVRKKPEFYTGEYATVMRMRRDLLDEEKRKEDGLNAAIRDGNVRDEVMKRLKLCDIDKEMLEIAHIRMVTYKQTPEDIARRRETVIQFFEANPKFLSFFDTITTTLLENSTVDDFSNTLRLNEMDMNEHTTNHEIGHLFRFTPTAFLKDLFIHYMNASYTNRPRYLTDNPKRAVRVGKPGEYKILYMITPIKYLIIDDRCRDRERELMSLLSQSQTTFEGIEKFLKSVKLPKTINGVWSKNIRDRFNSRFYKKYKTALRDMMYDILSEFQAELYSHCNSSNPEMCIRSSLSRHGYWEGDKYCAAAYLAALIFTRYGNKSWGIYQTMSERKFVELLDRFAGLVNDRMLSTVLERGSIDYVKHHLIDVNEDTSRMFFQGYKTS